MPKARKETDENYTPPEVITLVENVLGIIDLDPCSPPAPTVPARRYFTAEDDCLKKDWAGRVFLNPPYSNPLPFLERLCEFVVSGAVPEAIVLLKTGAQHNKGTGSLIKNYASAVCQWGAGKSPRIGFINSEGVQRHGADFDCIVVYFGHSWRLFEYHFSKVGHVMACRRTIQALLGLTPTPIVSPSPETNAQ